MKHGAGFPGFSSMQTEQFCPATSHLYVGAAGFGAVQATMAGLAQVSNERSQTVFRRFRFSSVLPPEW
jgi:hypothetical protein